MRLVIIFVLVFVTSSLMSQLPGSSGYNNSDIFDEIEQPEEGKGVIEIDQSARMKDLVLTHIKMNKRTRGIEGFRVQLYSGGGNKARQEAIEAKGKVLSELPDEDISVEYSAPFWRVRVGSFRHKHEALPLLNQLKDVFPSCYIVRDNEVSLDNF